MTAPHEAPGVPGSPGEPPGEGLRWQLVGDDGLLVDLPAPEAVADAGAALRAAPPEGVVDVVPAARTVLVRGSARGRGRWAAAVRHLVEGAVEAGARRRDASPVAGPAVDGTTPDAARPGAAAFHGTSAPGTPARAVDLRGAAPGRLVEITVVYDGADLAEVARLTGLTVDEVVARHAAARYRVAFGGFMPGFAYLIGLDPALVVPRLATPRTHVPAGAVAIAGEYAAVYPRATPGGWRLLGRTDAVMFDPAQDDRPALLGPGDEVRFVPGRVRLVVGEPVPGDVALVPARAAESRGAAFVSRDAGFVSRDAGPESRSAGLLSRATGLEVLATGPLVLVEDAGRPGLAAVGVPRSGAADPAALRAANRLVGNRRDAAVLEVVLGGLVVRFRVTTAFALVGAPAEARLDGREVLLGQAVRAPAGATLALGTPETGLRTWLAVRGGINVPPVLGSRSTDVLSALGPPPVAVGDVLPLGHAFDGLPEVAPTVDSPRGTRLGARAVMTSQDDRAASAAAGPRGSAGDPGGRASSGLRADDEVFAHPPALLSATIGPRLARLDEESRVRLATQEWVVTASSNRVALRLDGPPLALADDDELPSEGLVLGAVQVPHDGRPVVFGPDHPVTGGYPVVAVLTAEGVALAAQCRAGDRVRLVVRPL